jgi:tRNA G18 (ribose-2'-O)-methylase SpoU
VKLFRALQLKKKRDDTGLIVLEGGRQITDALRNKLLPKTVLMTKNAFETVGIESEIVRLCSELENRPRDSIVQLVSDNVFNSISETVNGQGIIATFQKPATLTEIPKSLLVETLQKPLLIVILDHLSDPGNMGTLLRSCYGLGVDCVISVNCCDIYSSKVLRSAMGVSLKLPIVEVGEGQVFDCLSGFQTQLLNQYDMFRNQSNEDSQSDVLNQVHSLLNTIRPTIQVLFADGSTDSINYSKLSYAAEHTVLVIGSEAHGISTDTKSSLSALTNRDIPHRGFANTTHSVQIPMSRGLESLNAAVAGSIILSEIAGQRRAATAGGGGGGGGNLQ